MTEKKFANMHYPGMKSDPNEGEKTIDEATLWYFKEQIESIGIEKQKKLLKSSAVLMGSNAVSIKIAQKLLSFGLGRVGVFGVSDLSGSYGVLKEQADELIKKHSDKAVLKWIHDWGKLNAPWADVESFSSISVDRKAEDIVRGFDYIIITNEDHHTQDVLAAANTLKKTVINVCKNMQPEKPVSSADIEVAACIAAQTVFNAALCDKPN